MQSAAVQRSYTVAKSYPAGASLDALGGKYTTADGKAVWLADVELEPYQALLVKKA